MPNTWAFPFSLRLGVRYILPFLLAHPHVAFIFGQAPVSPRRDLVRLQIILLLGLPSLGYFGERTSHVFRVLWHLNDTALFAGDCWLFSPPGCAFPRVRPAFRVGVFAQFPVFNDSSEIGHFFAHFLYFHVFLWEGLLKKLFLTSRLLLESVG